MNIGVMCASSEACDSLYLKAAYDLGKLLSSNNHHIIYGGGAKGLMNQVANAALENNGHVTGVIPKFMIEVEWQHKSLSELIITQTMNERKDIMMQRSDATIFLPGGTGTLEEFFVWLTAKRLGFYQGALILINTNNFYNPLKKLLDNMLQEKFISPKHAQMYSFIDHVNELQSTLENTPKWPDNAISFASVRVKK